MRTINLNNYPNICDKIQYEISEGKIAQLKFFLNNKIVLSKLCDKLMNVSVAKLYQSAEKIIEKAPFIQDLINDIRHMETRSIIKEAIYKNQRKD